MSDILIDCEAEAEGRWIGEIPDMGDLELLVRGFDCEAARRVRENRLRSWLRGVHPHSPLREPPQYVRDQAVTVSLQQAILLDWRNLTDKGEAVPYSPEMAGRLLTEPQWRPFRLAVIWAADLVGKSPAYVARRRAA